MNSTGMTLPSLADIDLALRQTGEIRDLLDAFDPCIKNMRAVLARRELALRDCRSELTAHLAELAERERHEAAQQSLAAPVGAEATPPKELVTPVPAERLLSFASLNGASSSNQSPR